MDSRTTFFAAVYLLIERENKLLFLRRANTSWMNGKLTLPAGHVDGDEKLTTAMIREAKEEIGIEIQEKDLILKLTCHRLDDNGKEYFDFYFSCDQFQGIIQNGEPHKCSELVWANRDELPCDVIPTVSKAISSIQESKSILEINLK